MGSRFTPPFEPPPACAIAASARPFDRPRTDTLVQLPIVPKLFAAAGNGRFAFDIWHCSRWRLHWCLRLRLRWRP